jgi:hypothetical protein
MKALAYATVVILLIPQIAQAELVILDTDVAGTYLWDTNTRINEDNTVSVILVSPDAAYNLGNKKNYALFGLLFFLSCGNRGYAVREGVTLDRSGKKIVDHVANPVVYHTARKHTVVWSLLRAVCPVVG